LPRLAVLAHPVGDGHHAVGRVLAEGPLADDVVQPPRPDLDPVLVAHLQEGAQPRLELARRPRQRPLRLQLPPRRAHLLVPHPRDRLTGGLGGSRAGDRGPRTWAGVSAGVWTITTDFTSGGSSREGMRPSGAAGSAAGGPRSSILDPRSSEGEEAEP